MIAYLLLAQFFGYLLVSVVWNALSLAGFWPNEPSTLEEFAEPRIRSLVLSSIEHSPDGSLRLSPTKALLDEMAVAPSLRFAVFRENSTDTLPGSSPDLVAALRDVQALSPSAMWFEWAPAGFERRIGVLRSQKTSFGRVRIATTGVPFRWYDVFYSFYAYELAWMPVNVSLAFVVSATGAWFAVRRGLAPLMDAAKQVALIDLETLHNPIQKERMPSEILPFVDAVNGALARLDASAARLRRFTANAAHELRTPVAILGARLDAPEEPSFKLDLKRDARRIRNIVEQLLASARLGSVVAHQIDAVDLVAATRTVVTDAVLLAIKNGRQMGFDAPSDPVTTFGDRLAIESVIANLIDNALRVEPCGGTVLVRVDRRGAIDVIDHGPGVAAEDKEQLFEPFWRKDSTTPGSGLGLAIAKDLMERLGGRIVVEETPGGGATFRLLFAVRGSHREPGACDDDVKGPQPSAGGQAQ